MLFSSLTFIVGFLPLTLVAVFVASKTNGPRAAIVALLIASLIFYSWQTPIYLALIVGSILVNFMTGRRIIATKSRNAFTAGVVFNLALLGWFKYAGLFSQTLSDLAGGDFTVDGVVLPLAISFFTFQQIAYLADCLKDDAQQYGILEYGLFVAFFPQLIAGPIVHHRDVTPQFSGPRFARFLPDDIAAGLLLFAIGLSKKVLIADALAPLADGVFDAAAAGQALITAEAWIGVTAYSFQIYFDFSGYSDMALGLALFFGVRLPMNFNSPYKARSIVDFWRRWHITLSNFLRDYLYFPLGGNRNGGLARYRNLFVVMLLGGLWHGAAWTFLVWGGLHGAYLSINHAWNKFYGDNISLGPVVSTVITFAAVTVAWVFFRASSFDTAFSVFAALAGLGHGNTQSSLPADAIYSLQILPIAAALVWLAPNALEILKGFRQSSLLSPGNTRSSSGAAMIADNASVYVVLLGALTAAALFVLMTSGPYEFIYFQF